jgi:hypothetical protein
MIDWKSSVKKSGVFAWLLLLLSACVGAREATSLPTPEPTAFAENNAPGNPEAQSTRIPPDKYADLEIVTLLPRDAIPAIDNPQFLSSEEADDFYDPNELVLGVTFDGDARAYSVPFLSSHEIVNDTVGGEKIAVTW